MNLFEMHLEIMWFSVLCWGIDSSPSWLKRLFWWFNAFMFNRLDFSHSWVISGVKALCLIFPLSLLSPSAQM
jgi:hypothetical protein